MDNQENKKNDSPRYDWRSFRFSEEFVNDPRETYFIEFGFGPTKMLVPYQLVMDVVGKMEAAIEEHSGLLPFASEVAKVEAQKINDSKPSD